MKEKWVAFTKKHAEIWKFIKFTFTGASTSVLELAVFAFLQYVVFKSMNTTPVTDNAVLHFLGIQYKGYMYSYAISAVIGYAAAYVMNRKLTFQADATAFYRQHSLTFFAYHATVALVTLSKSKDIYNPFHFLWKES